MAHPLGCLGYGVAIGMELRLACVTDPNLAREGGRERGREREREGERERERG